MPGAPLHIAERRKPQLDSAPRTLRLGKGNILLDSHGLGKAPPEITATMIIATTKDGGCRVHTSEELKVRKVILSMEIIAVEYQSRRRVWVIDGPIGFASGME